jgi:DNA-binding response OmpR family regulator
MSMTNSLLGRRIFIVEDEFLIAMMLEDMLLELGCVVAATAARPAQAFDLLPNVHIDAAILDVNLDGSDSFGIAAALRERQIPFLFATGYGGSRVPLEFAAYQFIQKPYRMEELAHAIGRLSSRTN